MNSNTRPFSQHALTPPEGKQSEFSRSMERLESGIRILTSFTLGSPLGNKSIPDKSSTSRNTLK